MAPVTPKAKGKEPVKAPGKGAKASDEELYGSFWLSWILWRLAIATW